MTATASRQRQQVEELVGAYHAALVAAGMYAGHPVTSAARTWLARVGVDGWSALSLAEQRATPLTDRRVVGWLMVTGRLRPSADYLVVGRPITQASDPQEAARAIVEQIELACGSRGTAQS